MSDDPPKLTVVAEQSERDREIEWATRELGWEMRELTANLLRVMRGHGRPYYLASQLLTVASLIQKMKELATAPQTHDAILAPLGDAIADEHDEDMRHYLNRIMRGAMQLAASNLMDQTTHKAAGRHEILDGVNAIQDMRERQRRERQEEAAAYARSIKPPKAKPRKKRPPPALNYVTPAPLPSPTPVKVEAKPKSTAEFMKQRARELRGD